MVKHTSYSRWIKTLDGNYFGSIDLMVCEYADSVSVCASVNVCDNLPSPIIMPMSVLSTKETDIIVRTVFDALMVRFFGEDMPFEEKLDYEFDDDDCSDEEPLVRVVHDQVVLSGKIVRMTDESLHLVLDDICAQN
jgi:hypothetical protein